MPHSHHLAWTNRDGGELVFHVTGSLTVGRSADNGIVIDEDGVSRRHVELTSRGDGLHVRDLGSTNGTFLNGTRIQEAVLRPGDAMLIGRSLFRLRSGLAQEDPTRTLSLGSATIEIALEASRAEYPSSEPSARAADHLRFLCRLIETINAGGSAESLYEAALQTMLETLDVDFGAVVLGNEVPAIRTIRAQRDEGRVRALSRTVLSRTLESGESILANDVSGDPELLKARSLVDEQGARILCVPIARGTSVLGALYLAADYGRRPLTEAELRLATVAGRSLALAADNLVRQERLMAVNKAIQDEAGEARIVGDSATIRKVLDMARRAAASEATILVTGETGTGKELIARAIHAWSGRSNGPFIAINCGALPESVVESELFGHEKGSFTGAVERRIGKFELADKGTLFLDEIGELSLDVQIKLLRVLEERKFFRIGGAVEVEPSVRVIAATNRALDEAVRAGSFREDLLYRVRVIEIENPPLRARTEDIVPIANHLLAVLASRDGRAAPTLSETAKRRLVAYGWPGNVRELRNVLERGLILGGAASDSGAPGTSDTIDADDLSIGRPEDAASAFDARTGEALRGLRDVEKEHIRLVLETVDWNKTKAAEVLGIGRTNIYEKIKQYGLEPSP